MAQDALTPDWRGWIDRGLEAFRQAQYSAAIEEFQRAADLNPSSSTPHLYLGIARYQGFIPGAESEENAIHAEQAAEQYRRALALDPTNWNALVLLGQVSFYLGRWEEARDWYRKAQALNPNHADVWYALGVVEWRSSAPGSASIAEAIANFEKAVALDHEHEDAMTFLSLLSRQRNDDIAARGWLDLAADVRSERVQREIARTATPRRLQFDAPDSLLQQWTSMALSFPPPPPPPPPPILGIVHEGVPAVVSWELLTAAEQQTPAPIRVPRSMQEQKLMTKVNPHSPDAGKYTLRFVVVIGKDGRVVRETLVSGHPGLAPAAVEALRQWVYEPTLVNGKPVEVVTEVLVPFQRAY
jgi:tetratricopeptide (TPR) repeat protein